MQDFRPRSREVDSRVVVHVFQALMLGLLSIRFHYRVPPYPGAIELSFAAWGFAYLIAYTTAPSKRVLNALIALPVSSAAAIVEPGLSIPFLLLMALVWLTSKRKKGVQEHPSASSVKTKLGNLSAEQVAAIGRLSEILARHGSALASENLFPYLNRPGFSKEATTASKRLIESWDESPLVTLGHAVGDSIDLAARSELTKENQRLALTNLRARKGRIEWERHCVPTPNGEVEVFARNGDERTASDLVDRKFLRDARERCGSDTVYFAIPTREAMLMSSQPDIITIMAKVRFGRGDIGESPLSPALFVFDGEGPLVPFVPERESNHAALSSKPLHQPDSKLVVHVCQGIALALLVYKRLLSAEENFVGLIDFRPFVTWMLFITWGIAYYLANTTPPVRRTSNAVAALGVTGLGVFTQSLLGFPFLAVLWWRRRAARILTRIVENDAEVAAAEAERSKRKKRKKKSAKKKAADAAQHAEKQPAAAGSLDAFAAQLGSQLAPENLFPFLNRPGFSEEATTASERLIETWQESPLMTLGHDTGQWIALAARSELTQANKRIALGNLRVRKERAEWQRERVPTPDGEVELFVRIGDELTASDLADPEFLKEAFERCGNDVAFFAIPTRESMVMASEPDIVALLAKQRFEDDEHGERPLTPAIFLFDGEGPLVPMIPQIPERTLN